MSRVRIFNRFKNKFVYYDSNVGIIGRTECHKCGALLFDGESDICCLNGKIKLRPINPPTDEVKNIYSGESATSKEFLKHIRGYNSRFAFTSLGTKNAEIPGRGPPTFKISGRMHHYIGQLLPPENTEAVFAQVYINDEEEQERIRLKGEFNPNSIRLWNRVMNSINPFAIRFRQIGMEGCPDKSYVLKEKIGDDRRRYNAPTASEVAILMPGDGSQETTYRDVVLWARGGGLRRINEMNPSYDPLHYPLLFPFGDFGWANDLLQVGTSRNITLKQFYAYRIMQRPDEFSIIHRGKRLFHEFLVDQYAKIETSRLDFLRNNQSTIRAELYQGK